MKRKYKSDVKVSKAPVATDQHGQKYDLLDCIGEGGQGKVHRTNHQGVLVKLRDRLSDEKRHQWVGDIQDVMRFPLEGLHVARPLALITEPCAGYVMELMDGLEPLVDLMQVTQDSLVGEKGIQGYIDTGGLRRRFRLLARLARTLADLHGRGLVYGDLSPANVFISRSVEHAEVWLIDADNITWRSRQGMQPVYTPDYGAPELMRGESGVDTLTESWSFAVMAYQLLTTNHPLKGDLVNDGEPELEDVALRGELPWVGHEEDCSNEVSTGITQDLVVSRVLRDMFDRCFNRGLNEPGARPSLAEWAEAFEQATGHCDQCEACGSSYFYNTRYKCPFCDHHQENTRSVLLRSYRYIPPEVFVEQGVEIPEDRTQELCWGKPDRALVLRVTDQDSAQPLLSTIQDDLKEKALCEVQLKEDGLWFAPGLKQEVILRKESEERPHPINRRQRLKADSRRGDRFELHLGPLEGEHDVWRFMW
ncbi:MAG: lipopolysaccharide kinase InaA family protein [Lautropia sp.]|nr:lipopolysaccharide kinase InaA family protein [Lautropia sp.]